MMVINAILGWERMGCGDGEGGRRDRLGFRQQGLRDNFFKGVRNPF